MEDPVAEEYKSSLADLNCNSKPLINMLTILAEENMKAAPSIVQTITHHIKTVSPESKLPCMYLIDSIVKNVRDQYLQLFGQQIVSIFATVFEKVDETTRMLLYKLRQTWGEVFSNKVLYSLDLEVKEMDPAWPVTAHLPPQSIHVNPKFLGPAKIQTTQPLVSNVNETVNMKVRQEEALKLIHAKQEQLRQLDKRKKELLQQFNSQNVYVAATPLPPPVQQQPSVVPKSNPTVSDRDPRLSSKVVIANVIKKDLAQTAKNYVSVNQATPAATPPKTAHVPSVPEFDSSARIPKLSNKGKNILPKPTEASQKSASQPPLMTNKQLAKSTSTPTVVKLEKHALTPPTMAFKRERSGSPLQTSQPRKKRKSEEPKKSSPVKVKEPSPKKVSKDRSSGKRKESPKKHKDDCKKRSRTHSKSPPAKKSATHEDSFGREKKPSSKLSSGGDTLPHAKHEPKSRKKEVIREEDTDLRVIVREKPKSRTEDIKENLDLTHEATSKEADSLFGCEDQDYRQIIKSEKPSEHTGWATYKAAHPDEFKFSRQSSLNSSLDAQPPGYGEPPRTSEKTGQQYYGELYDQDHVEYDRLGRPRLNRMRFNYKAFGVPSFQRETSLRYYDKEEEEERRRKYLLTAMMTNSNDMLRQTEEKYRLGMISEDVFHDIRRELKRVRSSEDYSYPDFNLPGYLNGPKLRFPAPTYIPTSGRRAPLLPSSRVVIIDGKSRNMHFVDDRAVALMDNNEPREVIFAGEPTQVFISGRNPVTLSFDGKSADVDLDGSRCMLRFGTPTRELYVNSIPHEAKFGGPPFDVVLNGRVYSTRLGGPPPKVVVVQRPAHDLYRKWCLITRRKPFSEVDFLRSKRMVGPRRRLIGWRPQLRDPSTIFEYSPDGQPPDEMQQRADRDFREQMPTRPPDWRALPPGMRESGRNFSPHHTPPEEDWEQPRERPPLDRLDQKQSARPWRPRNYNDRRGQWPRHRSAFDGARRFQPVIDSQQPQYGTHPDYRTEDSDYRTEQPQGDPNYIAAPPQLTNKPKPGREFSGVSNGSGSQLPLPPLPPPWMKMPLESTRLPLPPPPRPPVQLGFGLLRPDGPTSIDKQSPLLPDPPGTSTALPPEPGASLPPLDVSVLFQKLLAAGIIANAAPPPPAAVKSEQPVTVKDEVDKDKPSVEQRGEEEEKEDEEEEEEEKDLNEEIIPPIELKLESLKSHYPGVIGTLYHGSQCASCGMRFKEIQSKRYSRHLDWHFRVNRREKDGIKKAFSRKWYYEVEDWIQFEEFEHFEERTRSFFDIQADEQYQMEAEAEVPSVPVSSQEADEICTVCGEPFQLFWVEEEEEWHLRNAIRIDEQVYHPLCYEDFKKSLEAPVKQEPEEEEEVEEEKHDVADDLEVRLRLEADVSELVSSLVEAAAELSLLEPAVTVKEEPPSEEQEQKEEEEQEELLQGKPGEEEIIGLISNLEMEEEEAPPVDESEKIVLRSGGITMKVRIESLKPASPAAMSPAAGAANKETTATAQEEDEEPVEEFRPPTPDPRFRVLPPVQRGTELSGLCLIM